jgi:hypothetical protein
MIPFGGLMQNANAICTTYRSVPESAYYIAIELLIFSMHSIFLSKNIPTDLSQVNINLFSHLPSLDYDSRGDN